MASRSTTPSSSRRLPWSGRSLSSVGAWSLAASGIETSRTRLAAPALHPGGVRDDAIEPGIERPGVPESRQLAPGGDEGVLGRVRGIRLVRQDRPGEAIAAIDPGGDQHVERRPVAVGRAPDEGLIRRRRDPLRADRAHAWPRAGRPPPGATRSVGRPDARRGASVCERVTSMRANRAPRDRIWTGRSGPAPGPRIEETPHANARAGSKGGRRGRDARRDDRRMRRRRSGAQRCAGIVARGVEGDGRPGTLADGPRLGTVGDGGPGKAPSAPARRWLSVARRIRRPCCRTAGS